MQSTLFLIPNNLDAGLSFSLIPAQMSEKISGVKHFVVENEKNARRLVKLFAPHTPQSELVLYPLEKAVMKEDEAALKKFLLAQAETGLITDAGAPCVADPGSMVVALAHRLNIKVVPLVGPSSILLALMASGFNGQGFAFHGYLPIDEKARNKKLKELEEESARRNMTQLFIETPYRNRQMIQAILGQLRGHTRFCLACDLTSPEETIISQAVSAWKTVELDFHKRPAVFLIYAGQ